MFKKMIVITALLSLTACASAPQNNVVRGVVQSVNYITVQTKEGNPGGAVLGAALGAGVGSFIGKGNGRTASQIILGSMGAAAGYNSGPSYTQNAKQLRILTNDGQTLVFNVAENGYYQPGQRVRIERNYNQTLIITA